MFINDPVYANVRHDCATHPYLDLQLPSDPEAVQITVLRWGPWFL